MISYYIFYEYKISFDVFSSKFIKITCACFNYNSLQFFFLQTKKNLSLRNFKISKIIINKIFKQKKNKYFHS